MSVDTKDAEDLSDRRTPWLAVGTVVTVIALAASSAALYRFVSNSKAKSVDTQQHTYPDGISSIVLDIDYGNVEVVAHAASTISVQRRSVWKNNRPTIASRVSDTTLTLSSRCADTSDCEVDYVLAVPAGTAVRAALRDGDVSATGIDGALSVENGSGDVDIEQATGDVDVSTRDGNITATGLRSGRVDASTRNGDVRLGFANPPNTVRAASLDSGDVRVTLPRPGSSGVAYRVYLSTRTGQRRLAVADDPTGARRISASAVSGDVTVDYG